MPTPTPATPDPDDSTVVLDVGAFTSPERLECQLRFGQHWGDLLKFLTEALTPRDDMMTRKVIDPDGVQCWPDQVTQYLLWVQAKRTRPDAALSEFDALSFAELNDSFVDGLMGKARAPSGSRRSKRGPDSSAGSAAA